MTEEKHVRELEQALDRELAVHDITDEYIGMRRAAEILGYRIRVKDRRYHQLERMEKHE